MITDDSMVVILSTKIYSVTIFWSRLLYHFSN